MLAKVASDSRVQLSEETPKLVVFSIGPARLAAYVARFHER